MSASTPRTQTLAFARELGNLDASLGFSRRDFASIVAALRIFADRFALPIGEGVDEANVYARAFARATKAIEGNGRYSARFRRIGDTRVECDLCAEQFEVREWSRSAVAEHLIGVRHKVKVEVRAAEARAVTRR